MITTLFIVSLLALVYFTIATMTNRVAKSKIKKWESNGGTGRKPEVTTLPAFKLLGIFSGTLAAGIMFFWLFVATVGPQEVGVVKTPSGVKDTPLTTGWHLVLPWWDVYPMDKTVWVYTFSSKKIEGQMPDDDAIWAPTSEGIKMGFDMSISWRIDPKYAAWIYQNVSESDGGPDSRYKWIEQNLIRAKTKSVFALTCSKYTPIECYSTGRVKIQGEVEIELRKELAKLHLILDQVDIREVFYDPGYEAEIKNKKIQEQKYLTLTEITKQKEEELKQAEINKNIAIQQAEGEAKALQIKGNSINANPKIIELELIDKWNGQLPVTLINGQTGNGLLLNIAK